MTTVNDTRRKAQEWARLLIDDLTDSLRHSWSLDLAKALAEELEEVLQENLLDFYPPPSAGYIAEELAEDMRSDLLDELQEELPEDTKVRFGEALQGLVYRLLRHGQNAEQVWKASAVMEADLAERWAREVACRLVTQLFRRLETQLPIKSDVRRTGDDKKRPAAHRKQMHAYRV